MWDPDYQTLYWIDIGRSAIHANDWVRKNISTARVGEPVIGIALTASGGFVAVGSSGISLWNRTDGICKIASESGGQLSRMNDCIVDAEGRLFSASCFYDPAMLMNPVGSCVSLLTGLLRPWTKVLEWATG